MSTTLPSPQLPVIELNGNASRHAKSTTIALIGNPNAGKTSLFNQLTGLRAKTANFPGTTVEHRRATIHFRDHAVTLIDLPGLYSLEAVTPDERVAVAALEGQAAPDAILIVADSTNLERHLFLAGQVIELGRPTVVALNLIDAAEQQGLTFSLPELEARLGCPVVPVSARTGAGLDQLLAAIDHAATIRQAPEVHPALGLRIMRWMPLCRALRLGRVRQHGNGPRRRHRARPSNGSD